MSDHRVIRTEMAITTDRVSRRDGVKSGRPTVRDSKVSVLQVLDLVREAEFSPEEVADRYHDVPSAEAVRDALEWADENPEEVTQLRERRSDARDRLEQVSLKV